MAVETEGSPSIGHAEESVQSPIGDQQVIGSHENGVGQNDQEPDGIIEGVSYESQIIVPPTVVVSDIR